MKPTNASKTKASTRESFLTLDDAHFRNHFSGSPVKRIGRHRFVRNVLYAIGNSGSPALLSHAVALRHDLDPTVAEAAEWAIKRLSTAQI